MSEIIVHAKWINKNQFGFICPHCWSKYKKNGEPYKTAKRIEHRHGSCGDLYNRTEYRGGHCVIKKNFNGFKIIIDDDTIRL